jgi:hypothetical protein
MRSEFIKKGKDEMIVTKALKQLKAALTPPYLKVVTSLSFTRIL